MLEQNSRLVVSYAVIEQPTSFCAVMTFGLVFRTLGCLGDLPLQKPSDHAFALFRLSAPKV